MKAITICQPYAELGADRDQVARVLQTDRERFARTSQGWILRGAED